MKECQVGLVFEFVWINTPVSDNKRCTRKMSILSTDVFSRMASAAAVPAACPVKMAGGMTRVASHAQPHALIERPAVSIFA